MRISKIEPSQWWGIVAFFSFAVQLNILQAAAPPPNDDCTTATVIASFPNTQIGTTLDATDSNASGVPADCHPFPASSGGVWFALTGTGGTILATTCAAGTQFDTRLAVYTSGSSPGDCNALSCVTANDDLGLAGGCTETNGSTLSKVEWATIAGVTYYLYLDGFGTTTGNYELYVEETIPAPLVLTSFEAQVNGENNTLVWETLSESNTEWHIIERSVQGSGDWLEIERLEAAGFSSQMLSYEVEDVDAPAVAYYRLKTQNYDRTIDYSPVLRVARDGGGFQLQRLAPMPFEQQLEVQFVSDRNAPVKLTVFDFAGQQVFAEEHAGEDGANRLWLDLDWLEAGVYLIVLEQEGLRINERIVKQR